MPTVIDRTETHVQVWANHRCPRGQSTYTAMSIGGEPFDWITRVNPNPSSHCPTCGEKLPRTPVDVEVAMTDPLVMPCPCKGGKPCDYACPCAEPHMSGVCVCRGNGEISVEAPKPSA